MRAAAGRADSGETLIEMVVAIAIMSTAVVAVIGCLVTAITVSDIHRQQTVAGVTLRNYAEAINRTVDAGGYPTGCAALSVNFAAPAGYSASIVKVGYWPSSKNLPADMLGVLVSGSPWLTGCSTDSGLRQLTLDVKSNDGRADEQLVIVVRKPCRLGETLCA